MDSRTGELITATQAESGVYIWTVKNPLYFKISQHHERPFLSNNDILTIQVQFNYNLRKALGIHQCFLRIWTRLSRPHSLRLVVSSGSLRPKCLSIYITSELSVLIMYWSSCSCIMECIRACVYVDQSSSIKFNIY
ncbi:ren [Radish leaf curl virus-Hajipur [IN:LabIso:11]]|nr:REn [Radish leaf curl virus-Hajipur [IN:Bih:ok09]]ADZ45282.1 replication enhancer protein [Radish leaf curl virus-Hajipur [IN:Bih06:10]]AFI56230.1 ren [Radish leaf curl virus-Hajipur [IN:LabIso:11]]